MDVRFTLSIDDDIIKKAKEFAKKNNTSLSQLIENYLSEVTQKDTHSTAIEISPLVKSLSGVLDLPHNFNHKKDITQHLQEKYK